jgi:hypothetical protein
MEAVFVQVKSRARGNVTATMIVWAIVMAVVIFMVEASHGAHHGALWVGFAATALFGIYLGIRRRVAAAFIAPLVSWSFAWIPLWIAAMIRDGFFKGIIVGLFWVTIGWVMIGGIEFVTIFFVGSFIRLFRGSPRPPERDVIVYGPGGDVS